MRALFASVQVTSFPIYGCGEGLLFRERDLSLIIVVSNLRILSKKYLTKKNVNVM